MTAAVRKQQAKSQKPKGKSEFVNRFKTKVVPIDSIAPYELNYNVHPDAQVSLLAESIKTFSQYKNIVAWKGKIIAGEGVWRGMKAAGATQIEIKDVSVLTKHRANALMAEDNEVGRTSVPDTAKLAAIVKEIADAEGEALAKLAAGDAKALTQLLAIAEPKVETADPAELIDRAAELQKKWKCAKGDIWTAANHYWICGDCRDFETWHKLLSAAQAEKVNGVFTSPPYAEQRKKQYGGVPTDKYVEWWTEVQASVRAHLAQDGSFFINIKPHCENGERVLYVFDLVLAMQRQWSWKFVDEFCWRDTSNGMPGRFTNRFKDAFEPIYQFSVTDEFKFNPDSVRESYSSPQKQQFHSSIGEPTKRAVKRVIFDKLPSNVIECSTEKQFSFHGAPFPISLVEFFVKAFSDIGDIWLDPFLGSGTSIVAAHKNQRRGLGIEMLEKYCAVICERIEKETGETPKRVEAK